MSQHNIYLVEVAELATGSWFCY